MKKLFFTAVALLILSATTGARAQVTVGSTADPQPFSILELVSDGTKGLRLPQFNLCDYSTLTAKLEALTGEETKKAQGLQVFNICSRCVETWNGTKWIKQCEPEPPLPVPSSEFVEIPAVNYCCVCVPRVRFAKFNLGANPDLDTPKKQMKYLAEKNYTGTAAEQKQKRRVDAQVNGGLFQWGRKWDKSENGINSYQVSIDGSYVRYEGEGAANKVVKLTQNATYDDSPPTNTGQILTYKTGSDNSAVSYHVNSDVTGDWRTLRSSNNILYGTARPDLWGNGEGLTPQSDNQGGVYNGTSYYQNTDRAISSNDPCPPGFRVPTQDEWERLGNYDCDPSIAGGRVPVSGTLSAIGTPTNASTNLTWVPVVCTYNTEPAKCKCVPNAAWPDASNDGAIVVSGCAIYETDVWSDAITTGVYQGVDKDSDAEFTSDFTDKVDAGTIPSLHADGAPDPLLFLPAAGNRQSNSGMLYGAGSLVQYWSSTGIVSRFNTTYSYVMDFVRMALNPAEDYGSAAGFSVRCVVE